MCSLDVQLVGMRTMERAYEWNGCIVGILYNPIIDVFLNVIVNHIDQLELQRVQRRDVDPQDVHTDIIVFRKNIELKCCHGRFVFGLIFDGNRVHRRGGGMLDGKRQMFLFKVL